MILPKKGLSMITGLTLLLFITFIAFFSLNSWYNNYYHNYVKDIPESQIEDLEIFSVNNTHLLVRNSNNKIVPLKDITINEQECNVEEDLPPKSITPISIDGCNFSIEVGKYKIALETTSQIFSKTILVNTEIGLTDCSSIPGGNWSLVPRDDELGTPNFCVMKYEARWNGSGTIFNTANKYCGNTNSGGSNGCPIDGSIGIISKNAEKPLTQVNMYQADALCEQFGEGFSLITNRQWMAIARNVQFVNENWDGGVFNSGALFRGNNGINTPNSYNGNNPQFPSTNINARLLLDNGEEVWDMSGNIWEFVDEVINCTSIGQPCTGLMPQDATPNANEFITYDNVVNTGKYSEIELFPYNTSWNWDTNGIGNLKVENSGTNSNGGYLFVMIRGGYYSALVNERGGIFMVNFENTPYISNPVVGFRCTYSP